MDNAQGAGPSGAGGDWRARLQPNARDIVVNKTIQDQMLHYLCRTEVLKNHLPVSLPELLSVIQKVAEQFEEEIFNAATSQSDYLQKISLKTLSMARQIKMNTQENIQNGQVVWDKRANNLGDLKEELRQMNKTLKDQYVAGLGALYQISTKLHGDHHVPPQERINLHEEVNFKAMLERSLDSVQINNKCIEPSLEESIPMYKRQIISILNSEEWIPEQTIHHSTVQASSTSSTYEKNMALYET